MKFSKLSADRLVAMAREFREASEELRPDEINDVTPASIRHYEGTFDWGIGDAVPEFGSNVNWMLAFWSAFKPNLIGNCPRPACITPKRSTNKLYAPCINETQLYSDEKFHHEKAYEKAIFDACFRGTGIARHKWDAKFGVARTSYFNVRDVYPDPDAKNWEDAEFIIERHQCRRDVFAGMFGKRKAGKMVAVDTTSSSPGIDEIDGMNPLDQVEYFLLWSKRDGENRVIPFADSFCDEFLWRGKDKEVGDPFPFPMSDGRWHLSPIPFYRKNGALWGMSCYKAAEGPMRSMAWSYAFLMQASRKSSKQAMFYPKFLEKYLVQFSKMQTHMGMIGYDDEVTASGQKIRDLVEVFDFPALPDSLLKMFDLSRSVYEMVSGYNAAGQISPQGIETAGEMQGMQSAAENRLSMLRKPVEEFFRDCIEFRHRINADRMTILAEVKPYQPASKPTGPVGEADEDNPDYEPIMLPFEQAIGLTRPIRAKDLEEIKPRAEFNVATALASGQPPQPIGHPDADVRIQAGVPLETTMKMCQPGVAHIAGEENAQGWIEGATDWEIEANVEVQVEAGSSSEADRQSRMQMMERVTQLLDKTLTELQAWEEKCRLMNVLIDATGEDALQECKADPIKYAAQMQQQMDQTAQMENEKAMLEQKFQQELALVKAKTEGKAASDERSSEASIRLEQMKNESKQVDIQKALIGAQVEHSKEEGRRLRDRSKSEQQLWNGGV